jgi:hypothetical protein
MKLIFIIFGLLLSSPLYAKAPKKAHCYREYIQATKISELPPIIRESLYTLFEDKLGDSDSIVRDTDYVTQDVAHLPDYKFYRSYKIKDTYVVLLIFALAGKDDFRSFGYKKDSETGYNIYPYPRYFFRGPKCHVLSAIENNVTSEGDYPNSYRNAFLDKGTANKK